MPKIYCLKCNKPSIYESSRPIMCGYCGKPYIDTSSAATVTTDAKKPTFTLTPSISNQRAPINPVVQTYGDDDISGDATFVPQIGRIECEFNINNLRPNRQSSTEVFAEGARGVDKDFVPRQKPQKKVKLSKAEKQAQVEAAKSQFKNEFLNTSKTIRHSTEIE